jgi:hypothetical protein
MLADGSSRIHDTCSPIRSAIASLTARMLSTGASIETIALSCRLQPAPRFNLKRIFEKTCARSRAAVVALACGFIRRSEF